MLLVFGLILQKYSSFWYIVQNLIVFMFNISGILQKMKEGAENVERKIQAKVESLKNANEADKGEQKKRLFCFH